MCCASTSAKISEMLREGHWWQGGAGNSMGLSTREETTPRRHSQRTKLLSSMGNISWAKRSTENADLHRAAPIGDLLPCASPSEILSGGVAWG